MERCWTLRQNRQFGAITRRSLRRSAWIAGLCVAVLAQPGRAEHVGARVRGRLVEARILVDNAPAPLFARGWGEGPRYFAAETGRHYAIELRNRTSRRVGVLIAVDGLNVITGTHSDLGAHESIYVLGPRERTVIRGWRTSLDDVQQFVFVDEASSYAVRSGQANGGLGWIHVLTFEERPQEIARVRPQNREREDMPGAPVPLDESRAEAGASRKAAPDASAEAPTELGKSSSSFPGTGWGERRRDRVQTTVFDAIADPVDRLTFRYEYADGLRALGLLPARDRLSERECGEIGFAQPPRW